MKEATGETSMTFITIGAIALIAGFLAWLWPSVIRPAINNKWNTINQSSRTTYIPYVIENLK